MSKVPQTIIVPAEADHQRLDQWLAATLTRTRADVQRKLKRGEITIDGKAPAKDLRLTNGLEIVIAEDAPEAPKADTVPEPVIIHEDDDLLVIDKPAGLTMHGGVGIHEPTLADWLMQHRASLASIGDDAMRPGIVHRLDSDASGVVLIAKTQNMFSFLKNAFQNHQVEKHYRALVHGTISKDADTLTFPIVRSPNDGKMSARPVGSEGREAVTHFTIVERYMAFTLLDVTTDTGRTHQIRVHLRGYGHPITGDTLYHGRGKRPKNEAPRLFLHALSIAFNDIAGHRRVFEAPLPPDLQGFLKDLQLADFPASSLDAPWDNQ